MRRRCRYFCFLMIATSSLVTEHTTLPLPPQKYAAEYKKQGTENDQKRPSGATASAAPLLRSSPARKRGLWVLVLEKAPFGGAGGGQTPPPTHTHTWPENFVSGKKGQDLGWQTWIGSHFLPPPPINAHQRTIEGANWTFDGGGGERRKPTTLGPDKAPALVAKERLFSKGPIRVLHESKATLC